MSEALWIALIVSSLGVLSVWGKAYFDYKAKKAVAKKSKTVANQVTEVAEFKKKKYNQVNPGSQGPAAGEAEICKDNRDIIIETKTKVEKIEENIIAIFRILNKR